MAHCKDCLIWRNKIEDNKRQQSETIPALAKLGFKDTDSVNELYENLGAKFRELVSVMDNECQSGYCILCGRGR